MVRQLGTNKSQFTVMPPLKTCILSCQMHVSCDITAEIVQRFMPTDTKTDDITMGVLQT